MNEKETATNETKNDFVQAESPKGFQDDDSKGMGGKEGRPRPRRRRKVSYLTLNNIEVVDYKDVSLLRRFLNDQGKILPARQTGCTAREQRMVANAIRRAREMAILPFITLDGGFSDRGRGRGGRQRTDKEGTTRSASTRSPKRIHSSEETPTQETVETKEES
jgi:small subunit ribosomal protein S18